MKIYITINTRFEGVHHWPDAPAEVSFLKHLHRHVFHVKAVKEVAHHDRDIEFIMLKRKIDKFLASFPVVDHRDEGYDTRTWSCERWALELIKEFALDECEVSEDGENGARVVA